MKALKVLGIIMMTMMTLTFTMPFTAAEERTPSENRYYLGEAVKTGLDIVSFLKNKIDPIYHNIPIDVVGAL